MEEKDEGYSFVSETIKKKPINKKKLFRKTLITVSGAVGFGLIACLTFLFLEPVISNWLSPEEITKVEFPEEEKEVTPGQMLTEQNVEDENKQETEQQISQQVAKEIEDGSLALKSYQTLYDELYSIAVEASKSIVTVTGVSQDTDWFQNQVENINETSGVLVADNGLTKFFLADLNGLPDAESYKITLPGGDETEVKLKKMDPNTGLAIFAVSNTAFAKDKWEELEIAKLGNSNAPSIVGRPVIAVGSPLGQNGSICYGIITSNSGTISYADHSYHVLTTDMTGSVNNASGILINTSGQVLGILAKESVDSASGALLACFSISDLKTMVEEMSNGDKRLYLGVHGVEVTDEVHEELSIPYGIYVTEVDSGSPAMNSGITNGDVIVKIGNTEIMDEQDYQTALKALRSELAVAIKIKRFNGEKYKGIGSEITAEELK